MAFMAMMAGGGGMATMATISAISTVAGTIASTMSAISSAQAQESAINTQTLENEYKITKQKNVEMQNLHLQLAQNQMRIGMRGLSAESPTFNAIQTNEFNNTAKSLEQGTVALKINSLNQQSKVASLHSQLHYAIAGSAFGAAANLANTGMMYENMNNRIPSRNNRYQ